MASLLADARASLLPSQVSAAVAAGERHLRHIDQASDLTTLECEYVALVLKLVWLRRVAASLASLDEWAGVIELAEAVADLDAAAPGLARAADGLRSDIRFERRHSWWRSPRGCGFHSRVVGEVDVAAAVEAARRLAEVVDR